jgi:hypothetical protein
VATIANFLEIKMNNQTNVLGLELGDTLEVRLTKSQRGGLQSEERIGGRRAFVIEDRAFKWASAGEVWKVRLDSQNPPNKTLYFLRLISRVSESPSRDNNAASATLRAMAKRAGEHFRAQRFAEASVLYERALVEHPEEAFFAVRLACCFVELGRQDDAIHLYRQLADHYLETITELTGQAVDEIERAI